MTPYWFDRQATVDGATLSLADFKRDATGLYGEEGSAIDNAQIDAVLQALVYTANQTTVRHFFVLDSPNFNFIYLKYRFYKSLPRTFYNYMFQHIPTLGKQRIVSVVFHRKHFLFVKITLAEDKTAAMGIYNSIGDHSYAHEIEPCLRQMVESNGYTLGPVSIDGCRR